MKHPAWLATKLSALLLLSVALRAAPAGPDKVELLHLTDTHVVDLSQVAGSLATARQHFAGSGAELAKFLGGTTRLPESDLILITGDLIDGFSFAAGDGRRVLGQIDAFQRATAACRVPLFVLLGNHDITHYGVSAAGKPAADQAVAGEARAAWVAAVPSLRHGTYYAIERRVGATPYVVLMLDNGYSGAGAKDAPGLQMAHEQLYWLRRQVEAHADAVIVVALHVPLGQDAGSEAIKAAVAGTRNVALVLAGHNHKDAIDEVALGATTTVQVRTAAFGYGVNNWRRIILRPERIEVFATGKQDVVEKTILVSAGKR